MLTNSNIRGMGYRPLSNGGALLGTGRKYHRVFGNGPGWFGALAFNNPAMAWPSYGKLDRQTAMLAPFITGTIRGEVTGAATTDANIEGEGDLASEVTGLATTDALGELGWDTASEIYCVATTDADLEALGEMASELLIGGPLTGETIAGELFATEVELGVTFRSALRIMLSALAAKLSGAPTTTIAIRDVNDTKNRIVATVDANGNRTAVTLDPD